MLHFSLFLGFLQGNGPLRQAPDIGMKKRNTIYVLIDISTIKGGNYQVLNQILFQVTIIKRFFFHCTVIVLDFARKPPRKNISIYTYVITYIHIYQIKSRIFFQTKSYLCQDDLGFWHQNCCPKQQNIDEVLHYYSVFVSIIFSFTRSLKVIPLNCSKEDLLMTSLYYFFWHKMFTMC